MFINSNTFYSDSFLLKLSRVIPLDNTNFTLCEYNFETSSDNTTREYIVCELSKGCFGFVNEDSKIKLKFARTIDNYLYNKYKDIDRSRKKFTDFSKRQVISIIKENYSTLYEIEEDYIDHIQKSINEPFKGTIIGDLIKNINKN